jgi:hypothetical protein
MLYLPPCKGRTFSTAGQHQLKKGDPCLQLQGRTYSTAGQHQLKGISLSASGQHQLLRGDPCLQLVNPSSKWDIHVYSWPTPAIKGRSSLQKGRSLSTADQHQLKGWERSYSTAGQHQLLRGEQKKLRPALCYKGRSLSTAGEPQL